MDGPNAHASQHGKRGLGNHRHVNQHPVALAYPQAFQDGGHALHLVAQLGKGVGDFGVGYEPTVDDKNLEDLNKFLAENNCTVYAIRGNHDDPSYFEGNHIFSNLKLMPDYSQEIIEGKKFLFCGGAISIDRKFSLSKMQMSASHGLNKPMYWWDEAFDLDLEELEKIRDVEIVITHTAPEWAFPQNKNGFGDFVTAFFFDDAELEADLLKERAAVSKFFQKL
jgi:hypothetical protein